MALTPDQDAYFRSKLGSGYDSYDAEQRLIRLGGTGYEPGVVVEVLEQRLADLAIKPDSYTVVGEYSETWSQTQKLVQAQLVAAQEEAAEAGIDAGGSLVTIQQPARYDWPDRALDTEEFLARGYGTGTRLPGGR